MMEYCVAIKTMKELLTFTMDATGYYVEINKSDPKREISHTFLIWGTKYRV